MGCGRLLGFDDMEFRDGGGASGFPSDAGTTSGGAAGATSDGSTTDSAVDAGVAGAAGSAGQGSAGAAGASPVAVTASATGSGQMVPTGVLPRSPGDVLTFSLSPRTSPCTVQIGGSCGGQLNAAQDGVEVIVPSEDCTIQAAFDCGPSTFEIRPEHVGIFWENRTQPMTATEIFASGAKVDVTQWVQWSTSDETVLAIDDGGLATALVDHGVLEIRARDPQHPPSTAVATTATIVKVTQWRHPIWEMGEEYKDAVLEYATGNVYLNNVQFTSNSMSWEWAPRPWVPFQNTVSGFLWAFWSEDGGLTYHGVMWDYITNNHTGKGLGCGMPAPWMGTMLSTVCDKKAGECNGRERTNIYFATHPGPHVPFGC